MKAAIVCVMSSFVIVLIQSATTYPYYYYYNKPIPDCSCSNSDSTGAVSDRIWIFSLDTTGQPNNPPPGYTSIIARVSRSEKGAMPFRGLARLNALIDQCVDPFSGLSPDCTYRVHVKLQTIKGRTHFIVHRCYPPEEISCSGPNPRYPNLYGCKK